VGKACEYLPETHNQCGYGVVAGFYMPSLLADSNGSERLAQAELPKKAMTSRNNNNSLSGVENE